MVLFKLCCSGTPRYFKLFTFHYGPIQILDIEDITSIGNYLHSTMVLFKLISLVTLSPFSPAFTFHYGPIQIIFVIYYLYQIKKFTFHYGPIQMAGILLFIVNPFAFTFHYGPIQMYIQNHSS